jgi:hypothetical protein
MPNETDALHYSSAVGACDAFVQDGAKTVFLNLPLSCHVCA